MHNKQTLQTHHNLSWRVVARLGGCNGQNINCRMFLNSYPTFAGSNQPGVHPKRTCAGCLSVSVSAPLTPWSWLVVFQRFEWEVELSPLKNFRDGADLILCAPSPYNFCMEMFFQLSTGRHVGNFHPRFGYGSIPGRVKRHKREPVRPVEPVRLE